MGTNTISKHASNPATMDEGTSAEITGVMRRSDTIDRGVYSGSRVPGLDRRQHDRHPTMIEVIFHDTSGQRVVGQTRDISLGGLFIETDRNLPYGTSILLQVQLPALAAPSIIEATVRWSCSQGIGVQFGALRPRETWAINELARP